MPPRAKTKPRWHLQSGHRSSLKPRSVSRWLDFSSPLINLWINLNKAFDSIKPSINFCTSGLIPAAWRWTRGTPWMSCIFFPRMSYYSLALHFMFFLFFCSIIVMPFAHFCCQELSRKRVRTRLLLSHELRVQYVDDGRHITQQVQATDGCSSTPTQRNHRDSFTLQLLPSYSAFWKFLNLQMFLFLFHILLTLM